MTCRNFTPPNRCTIMATLIDSPRVCFHCGQNTARGQWPTRESLPPVPVIQAPGSPAASPAVPHNPCTGCGKPDPTKPFGSPAAIADELGGQ